MNQTVRSKVPSHLPDSHDVPDVPSSHLAARLSGIIAHDLRTPITVIRGYLKMLIDERIGTLTEEQKKCLEAAMRSVAELTQLAATVGEVSGLLPQIQPEILDLRELWANISSSLPRLVPQVLEKNISLESRFLADQYKVFGDRRTLSDVIEKLTVSAIEHARRDTPVLMELSRRRSGHVVIRIILDCGSAIPNVADVVSELHTRVFLHGGQLKFNSQPESGMSFTFSVPGIDS